MIYVSTRAGKRHKTSEDAVLVGTEIITDAAGIFPVPDQGFVCVADGVGGNKGGAQAARFVLNALAARDHDEGCNNNSCEELRGFLIKTNQELIEYAAGKGSLYEEHKVAEEYEQPVRESSPDMAATLTGICFTDTGMKLVHVGNTRVYVRQGKYLKQITSDHTTYQWLMSTGRTEAAEKCNKSEITNCFGGGSPALLSKLYVADFQQFSLALLTSDGIHEYVDPDSMEEILAGEGSYADKCEALVRKAKDAGSEDDLSAVIIDIYGV